MLQALRREERAWYTLLAHVPPLHGNTSRGNDVYGNSTPMKVSGVHHMDVHERRGRAREIIRWNLDDERRFADFVPQAVASNHAINLFTEIQLS